MGYAAVVLLFNKVNVNCLNLMISIILKLKLFNKLI